MNSFESVAESLSLEASPVLPPDIATIRAFTEYIRSVLFGHSSLTAGESAFHLRTIHEQSHELIARAFSAQQANHPASVPPEPDGIAWRLVKALPGIRTQAQADILAALRGDPAARDAAEVIAYYPGFHALLFHRIAHKLHGWGVPYLPRGITEQAHTDTGIDIHPGAVIGSGLFIDHGTGVVIGETAHIGDDVKLYQGVTLGALSLPKDNSDKSVVVGKRHPTIEDRAVIYANATILGGNTVIGHDAVVGANAWIKKSVEAGSTVGIEPPALRVKTAARA